jgi:dTDP-4-amino-4,6-dideoxygalactose transaminase
MLYELPPAGNAISLRCTTRADSLEGEAWWRPFHARWFGSGTSALAAAVVAAVARKGVSSPEVIVPAYCCPDVISAVLYAGASPVLVDLAPGTPWMDLSQIESRISASTVAIIAINFLGVPERGRELRRLADTAKVTLIDDCAQFVPAQWNARAAGEGEFTVLSFGRGKPVSLLGGGALLTRDASLLNLVPTTESSPRGRGESLRFGLKVSAYNVLRRPRVYWVLRALPFLGLGRTVFSPLHRLEAPPASVEQMARKNIERYRLLDLRAAGWIREAVREFAPGKIVDLPTVCGGGGEARLLRYPVLVLQPGKRDRLYDELSRAGLGASRLYERPLNEVPGVPDRVTTQDEFANARQFAQSLLTLPTHTQVRQADVDKMKRIMRRVLG